jgi:hypothetical protein
MARQLALCPPTVQNIQGAQAFAARKKIASLSRAAEHRMSCRKKFGFNIPADWAFLRQ